MHELIKKILIKLRITKPISKIDSYIRNGNIIVGKNSNISMLSVTISNPKKNVPNVIIGDDCIINGSISIYNPDANITIGDRVFIGERTELFCYKGIVIESDIMLSWGITVIDTNAHSLNWEERKNDVTDWIKGEHLKNWQVVESKEVLIKSKSWIGFKSIILKGVVIDNGTIVGSGSVVTKNTEAFTIVAGNPAKFIKHTN